MSGVEIAGFVLAAFPLLISALEHYRETAEVLEGWWNIKTEYKKCMRNIKYHQIVFEENLEELLLPLIADEEKLQRLLQNPGGHEWDDTELEKILQKRMPKTYSVYLDTIKMMAKTQKSPGLVAHVSSSLGFHGQVIKIAFSKTVLNQLFEDFGCYNARLRDILGSSDRLATIRKCHKSLKGRSSLSQKNMAPWQHRLQAPHEGMVMPMLVLPSSQFVASASTYLIDQLSSCFLVYVSSQATPSTTSVGSFQKLNASSASNSPASATTTSTQRISKLDRAFLMKKLRWSRSTDVAGSSGHHAGLTTSSSPFSPTCMAASSSSSSTTVIVTENTPIGLTLVTDDVATTEQADHSMIANLCSKIATSEDLSSFGYLKEEALEYSVKPLFKASKQPQLHSSWSKNDILFVCDANDKSKIHMDKPYVSRPVTGTLTNDATSTPLSQPDRTFQESIHNLGIMLLELCFGKTIEDHELCAGIEIEDERIKQALLYGIASKWAQDVVGETGLGYSDAVEWCLHYRLESCLDGGASEKWREDMVEKVVEPLKECYDQLITI
ncbi:uncharacterized protein LY89DRAFT_742271 [Mollisia scopiformis]|uniref:DUF7580 domain-containing protein n=1 Tax=Mollisia scopiformis TaxID=149040 RepID=A0A132B6E9_MOLSC|nr:uncharacterized protein LY89DRAFT_742271 [Mollisia scopiformis]KUJ07975.1 hypothetical protein LY89DRAFT_742271 [Mollisia scopiformis]